MADRFHHPVPDDDMVAQSLAAMTGKRAKRAWLDEYKLKSGCVDCGYNKHPAALDFDHLPQFEKQFNISQIASSLSWQELRSEILKCEVVCANCHRERTVIRTRYNQTLRKECEALATLTRILADHYGIPIPPLVPAGE